MQVFICVLLLFATFSGSHAQSALQQQSSEGALKAAILNDHDAQVVPRRNSSEVVVITTTIEVLALLDVDARQQVVELSVIITQNWTDQFLIWNPAQFGGQKCIVVQGDSIWHPSTMNGASTEFNTDDIETKHFPAVCMTGGRPGINESLVTLQYTGLYRVSCEMDVKLFPWDSQHCALPFFSISYFNKQVTFQQSDVGPITDNFAPNGAWTLTSVEHELHTGFYDRACNRYYDEIVYIVTIKRKPMYYIVNLLLPCVVINLICIVGLFTHPAPDDRGDKVTLGLTGLLSLSVYLLIVNEDMPTTSDNIPLMTLFFIINFLFLCVSMGCSVLVAKLGFHAKDLKPFGPRELKVYNFLFRKEISTQNTVHDGLFGIISLDLRERDTVMTDDSSRKTSTEQWDKLSSNGDVEDLKIKWTKFADKIEQLLLMSFTAIVMLATFVFIVAGYAVS